MNISLDCIPCFLNSFLRLLKKDIIPQDQHEEAIRRLLAHLSQADYNQSPASLGRETHRIIRELLHDPDPYLQIKNVSNQMMLEKIDHFRKLVRESADPFSTALRLAIAGNVIDYGPQHQLDVWQTIENVLNTPPAIDDSESLRRELTTCKHLLYIGDNCGEIVLDKVFLETMAHPNVYFAVRGAPAINDATIKDAQHLGIDQLATVITTGDDAPGAVWETVSQEFKDVFLASDVIISKGQGNLEGLIDVDHNIYFLYVAKCDLIAGRMGAHTGDFIVKHNIPASK
jgi:damage-control phosphatase, subfamily I